MTTNVTDEVLGRFARMQNDHFRRLRKGAYVDPEAMMKELQRVIEWRLPLAGNAYIEQVAYQLDAWRNLGVGITKELYEQILEQAEHFVPDTDSDVPLVTGGFGYANPAMVAKKLFEAFTPPSDYTKCNYFTDAELRFVRGMKPTGGLRLVHYDPNTYAGLSPEAAIQAAKKDKVRLAGLEVLEYLVLNPESGLKWDGKNYFYPNLSGLEQKYEGTWSHAPFLSRWFVHRHLELRARYAGDAGDGWSSPVAREC